MSVLPIAQAHVLRWVLMGGNINESRVFLAWPYRLCPGVSTAVPRPFGGVVVAWNAPGRGLCGLCLAHCWVLRQQDLFAAMHGGIFWCFFCSCFRYHRSLSAAPLLLWVWGLWCPGVWLMGLLFENYIVDASIWNTHVCVFLQQFLMNEPGPCGHGSLE